MKRVKLFLWAVLFMLLGYSFVACGQGFVYKSISSKVLQKYYSNVSLDKYVNATKYLPRGYNTRGLADYTDNIQRAIDRNKKVIMPNFPVLINENGLKLRNDTELFFQKNSKIIVKPNKQAKYSILLIQDVSNVKIFNPTIVGDRTKHLGTRGEWGMGISIYGGRNIEVYNPKVQDCWGDGLYISHSDNNEAKNVKIIDGYFDNNRRNAISIISVDQLLINGTLVSNTNGTAPMSGICIEPNSNVYNLANITIKDVSSFNNVEYGLAIVTAKFIGEKKKYVSIDVDRFQDSYSKNILLLGGTNKNYPPNFKKLEGYIRFKDVKGINNKKDIIAGHNFSNSPQYSVENLQIITNGRRDNRKEGALKQSFKNKAIITN
ncbi:right-handed parallel beta-helix repeat-containing protein [Sphingobacterium thalpophilum]|uniref:right-handed parallel beta-helix repeat-containing protein n=1 Tax=Sphingobacterium thalpophilum TaxID=259 RepID=UPI003DA561DC